MSDIKLSVVLLALVALGAAADPVAFELRSAGLSFAVELPAESGPWRVESPVDDAGTFDVIVGGGAAPVTIVVAVGDDCDEGFGRLVKRTGLALLPQRQLFGAAFRAEGTEDVDFRTGTTTHVGCAAGLGRSLVAVLAHGGLPEDLGPAPTAVLGALAEAFKAAGEASLPYQSPGGAVPAPLGSATARARYMADPSAAAAAVAARTGSFTLPAGTTVIVALDAALSSKTAQKGAALSAKVAEDVLVDDAIVIKAGAPVIGKVVDASSGGVGGRPGKVSFEFTAVTAVDGQSVALKYRAEKAGKGEGGYSFFTGINLSAGSQVEYGAGTPFEAPTAATATITVK